MKVILFGATGMVGAGVLRECLLAQDVEQVLTVGRRATGVQHEKLREIVHENLFDLTALEGELSGYDAGFYCLGVSSIGMSEAEYRKISYEMTLAVAGTLARLNPAMTFVFVTGAGADSSEQGRVMWARVKGAAENALLRMPFKGAYMFRPAVIQPLHGIRSKTRWYQFFYDIFGPLLTLGRRWFPRYVTTTEQVGRAMLAVARRGGGRGVLENADIHAAG
jgi:uncharacterized protein YbjT (DUF2867 family)